MTTPRAWDHLADDATIERTIQALRAGGIAATVVENGAQAKEEVLRRLPAGREVFTLTSQTLDAIGLTEAINNSGRYISVRDRFFAMDRATQRQEMNRLGAAPAYAVGSVHAITEDGHILVASRTGSQLPAYAYGAGQVIWVVGAQKIVRDLSEGLRRIYEHCLPLENERALRAYGVPSGVSKILILREEIEPGRLNVILVKEKLGF